MNGMVHFHAVSLQSPYYNGGNGTQLHRYLEPDFVQRFKRELQLHQLGSAEVLNWKQTDRFSDHDDKVVLRLPMHRSFYVVSCEVVCERLGHPALDPQKITSAGFVIRRLGNGGEQSWMLEEDEPAGWEDTSTGLRDPDVHRRLCRDGSLHPREDVPTYTGEQTYPLHPETGYDEEGKRHTVLFGFLPLGGTYTVRQNNESPFDPQSLQDFSKAASEQLPWPYGQRKPLSKRWRSRYARPIENGMPSKEFFELLRLLVNRYHLGEGSIAENEQLQELSETIYFYQQSTSPVSLTPANYNDYTKDNFRQWRKYSLWSWLQKQFSRQDNPLVAWITEQEKKIDQAGGLDGSFTFDKLPARTGSGKLGYSLYLTSADARDFRTSLDQRVLSMALSKAKEIPLPKFQQGIEDVYQIVPFVRARDDNGKERIYWAGTKVRSEEFRVAAPFDPNASRPSMIQMPSLGDLKKGLAQGVSMITPADTFNLVNALNLKKGASEDVLPAEEPGGIGIQWICSFSLPVITLVAMILLMIMISLLNIVFFWMPWIKICLPFPKIK
jgi:hypothetical protein